MAVKPMEVAQTSPCSANTQMLCSTADITDRRRAEDALRDAEARNAAILRASLDAIITIDHEGLIRGWNPAAERIFGHPESQVLGQPLAELIIPASLRQQHRNGLARCLATGAGTILDQRCEMRALRADGSEFFAELTVTRVAIEGRPMFTGYLRDITERKRADAALDERSRLSSLVGDVGLALTRGDSIRDLLNLCTDAVVRHLDAAFARIWTLNEDGDVLELQASSGMYTHIDGPHARVPVGKFKIGLIAEEKQPHLTNDVIHDPRVGDHEWALREGMVAFAGYPLMLEDRLIGVMAMFARQPLSATTLNALGAVSHQIAVGIERKWAASERDDLLQRLQLQIERMPLAYLLLDADARIIDWNPSAQRTFGYSKEEVLGMGWPFEKILPTSEQQSAGETLGRLRAGDMAANSVNDNLTKDGRTITCEWFNTPLMTEDGRFAGLLSLAQDVTDRRRLEEQFRQSQKMEAIGKLAGGIAHDFNNLLTVINGYSEMLLEEMPAEDANRELVAEIQQSGDRAATLTRQLLAFSRRQVLLPEVLDLNSLIDEMEKLLRRLIGEDVDLRVRKEPDLWRIESDPGQLEQVVMNLVINSRDAMPKGGMLTIQTANVELDQSYAELHAEVKPGDYVELSISDTGHGMDRATQARVFEPFFTTKERGKGTGLGLSTVYGIVRQSGGHIQVYSEVGVGTTFKIYLPHCSSEGAARVPVHSTDSDSRGSETVLVVEDEPGVRSLTRTILEERGYQLLVAADGEEALLRSEQFSGEIHIMVSDVVMPRMSGPQLAERLAPLRPKMRVLFVSGYTDDAIVHHGILGVSQSFLHKPFKPAVLARRVREVLDAGG